MSSSPHRSLENLFSALFLTSVCFTGTLAAQEKDKPQKPPVSDAVLNPLAPRPAEAPPLPVPPELPDSGFPVDVNEYENPLLHFEGAPTDLSLAEELDADLLPPISPYLPGEPAEESPSVTPEQQKLMAMGARVATSVMGVRVWDSFGVLLASGIGSYVTADGIILTDAGLLHPEIAGKADYITLVGADGTSDRVSGFYIVDTVSGVALLQSENMDSIPLDLNPGQDFGQEQRSHVLAMSEKRGLVLAEARVQSDSAITALGWLNVRGDDSPGAVGSPVLDDEGRMTAMIGMQVPLKSWKNYALPVDAAALALRQKRAPLRPLKDLPKKPGVGDVVKDPAFIEAFQTLEQKLFELALRKLIQLTRKYPRSAECWALLGLCATHLGAAPEAVNCQRKAVALDPKAGLYWHQLAFAKLRDTPTTAEQTEEDRDALIQAVQQRPNDQVAWLLLASRHVRDGELTKADDALRRVTLLAPEYAQAHYLQAYVRGRLKDYTGAQTAISQSLKLNSSSSEAWYYQGLLFDKRNDPREAAKAYRNAVRLRPDHPQAWMNLAHAYKKAGLGTEARQAFIEHQKRNKNAGA
ncbi:S1 family peptidase [Prosthecobacter fusiformis]|nr:serine protease [Prosthecobacter fusiformis]